MTRRLWLRPFALLSLVLLAVLSLSGCVAFGTDCPSSYTLEFEERSLDGIADEVLTDDPEDPRLVSQVVASGPVTETTIAEHRLDNGTYVRENGSYYLLTYDERTVRQRDGYALAIEYDSEVAPPRDAEVVDVADLPAGDRAAFRYLLPGEERVGSARSMSGGRDFAYPNASAESSSLLLERGSLWVRADDRVYNVTVESEARVPEYGRTYEATLVAANESAWISFVDQRFVRNLTLSTAGQRDVVREAIDSNYRNCTQEPTGDFGAVVDRLDNASDAGSPGSGTWYVRYDGGLYDVDLLHAVV